MLFRAFLLALLVAGAAGAAPGSAARRAVAPPATPAATSAAARPATSAAAVSVSPAAVRLSAAAPERQLLVTATAPGGPRDLTGVARYQSDNPRVATVSPGGRVRWVAPGAAVILVRAAGQARRVAVRAEAAARPPTFVGDVAPLLSKAGCYAAACHAKQGGQGGFQLSVLGFDLEADWAAVRTQGDGRRLNRLDPARSLLLLKPTLALPHAGGRRLDPASREWRLLAEWIAAGAPFAAPGEPMLERVEVEPAERVLGPGARQQLRVTAHYRGGPPRDVTGLADYLSNETSIAEVEGEGRVRALEYAGEAAVMVRYQGQVAVARFTVPRKAPVAPAAYAGLPRFNLVDEPVYRKLSQLNLLPSPLADDATFLRRASLDLIGTLPTAEEARAFLAECAAEGAQPARKARERLVDRLLQRPEYADYWAMRWVNLLLVDRDPLFPKGAFAYDHWVRESFRRNQPYDEFARDLITAAGETYRDGPANFYRALATPVEQGKAISQLFLGVRLDCAQCHHHPNERWSQDDFYGMAAFFARVRRKGASEFEQVVFHAADGEVRHPKTDAVMPPRPPGGAPVEVPEGEDRREALARWITAPDNPFFARAAVNRVWALLMGRGLVEPADDFRASNPAVNEPLLDALAADFRAGAYDLKRLLRTITLSAAYQRSSAPTPNNARDTRNYSHALVKRLPAEVLLDAIGQVTGVPETYTGHPEGTRAIQMWDNKLPVEFLDIFGRPARLSVCECDRPADGSVTQVLHLMNSPAVQNRLTDGKGLVARLDAGGRPPEEVIRELYLTAYSRYPTEAESRVAAGAFTRPGASRRAAIEDLLWVLLNSPEFVFNH
jgi:hypothetical protein